MLRNHEVCKKYDLSSVKSLFTGAAPLGMETAEDFQKMYPDVTVRQGYGKLQLHNGEICAQLTNACLQV